MRIMGLLCLVSWLAAFLFLSRSRRIPDNGNKSSFFEKVADGILTYPGFRKCYREPVKRWLLQMHPTEEIKELCRKFYREKLVLVLKIWFMGVHLTMFLALTEPMQSLLTEENSIRRGSYGEAEQALILEVGSDDFETQEISYDVHAQKYSQNEISEFIKSFLGKQEELIRGENQSLREVKEDLNLAETYPAFPMQFSWKSSNASLIEENGEVHNENLTQKESAVLTFTMTYDEAEYVEEIEVCILPKDLTAEEIWKKEILSAIRASDEEQKYSDKLVLPAEITGKKVSYTLIQKTQIPLYLLLLLCVVSLLFWAKDNDLKKQSENRKRNLSMKYPEFVSKFQLLLGAGMTVRNIFLRLCEDESLGPELGQELKLMVRDMKNGLSVKEALDKFGKRCAHPLYIKFSALLAQNIKKGTGDLLEQLTAEVAEAFTLRKMHARQLGEEAGTKLLGPMVLLLAIVMAMLMIPAFLSFQF